MSYSVRVSDKKESHPWYNQGSKMAYTFDNEEGKNIEINPR